MVSSVFKYKKAHFAEFRKISFYPNLKFPSLLNEAKTENIIALKRCYLEQYLALKKD